MTGRSAFSLRTVQSVLVLLAFLLTAFSAQAAPREDYRAVVKCQDGVRDAQSIGRVMTNGSHGRLDVRLGKAGDFSLLVDGEEKKLLVLSHRLKAYVESAVEGDALSWRGLVHSVSSVLLPQTLGLVSFQEKSCQELGRERVGRHEAEKSRCVFTLGFMGSYRDVTVDVWDSKAFVSFPLKVEVIEDERTRGGKAWLADIEPVREGKELFLLPEGYTRFTSVLDLILYALSAL